MSRAQIRVVAALSIVATAFVLIDGTRGSQSNAALEAAKRAVVVHASLPAAAVPAPTPATQPVPAPAAAAPTPAPVATTPTGSATTTTTTAPSSPAPRKKKPASAPKPSKVKHVFVIALTGSGEQQTFAAGSPATYLATDLAKKGTLLAGFHPLDGADLPNYIAATGGQPPNADTGAECTTFTDFPSSASASKAGVESGDGCVYPNTVLSIGDQITASSATWKAYSEDMDSGPEAAKTCRHPQPGSADDTLHARPGDEYATRHNPFVYYHSLLDLGDCQANDVALDQLATDLKTVWKTPSYAFIAPNLCDDGTESPCVDGRPGGSAAVDAFLRQWVPKILASSAYKHDGVLIVAFLSSAAKSATATGALVLSRYARAGHVISAAYDPYSLLRSVEDLLALKPLARAKGAPSFAKATLPGAF